MTAHAFGFTKLVVKDLDRLVEFYCEVFGLQERRRVGTDQHRYALDEALLSLPSSSAAAHSLVITRYRQLPPPPAGAAWTGFVVDDIEATLALLSTLGGKVEVAPHRNPEHAVIAAIATDPEGHLIEIIQLAAPSD